ncbi:hypothetical protein FF1_025220 [Malus domestica]
MNISLSLHGNKDQTDRESTTSDFKSIVCDLLIATSLASRGLDVKVVELVINFDTPDHYEDYVRRIARKAKAVKKAQAKEYGFEDDKSDSEDEDDGVRKAGGDISQEAALAQISTTAAASKGSKASVQTSVSAAQLLPNGGLPVSLQHNLAKIQADGIPEHYEAELEINDIPQNAQWKGLIFPARQGSRARGLQAVPVS